MIYLVIGNGFDLAHGMKSSYKDFITHVVAKCNSGSEEYSDLVEKVNVAVSGGGGITTYARPTNDFFDLMKRRDNENWCDIESLYFECLNNATIADSLNLRSKNGKDDLKGLSTLFTSTLELNQAFKVVKNHFENYISRLEIKKLDTYKLFFESLPFTTVVNFNYTTTVEQYFLGKIINIHGQCHSDTNPIIFGYAANEDQINGIISKANDKEPLRHIKRFNYAISGEYDKLNDAILSEKNVNSELWILGHSCGLSDSLILQRLIEEDKIKKIRFFVYNGKEEFLEKHFNISKLANSTTCFDKLIPFSNTMAMPQENLIDEEMLKQITFRPTKEWRPRAGVS